MEHSISCMEYVGVKYRRTDNQVSTKKYEEQQACANRVRKGMFQYYGIAINKQECKNIQLLSSNRLYEMTWKQFLSVIKILYKLKRNLKKGDFKERDFIIEFSNVLVSKIWKELKCRVRAIIDNIIVRME